MEVVRAGLAELDEVVATRLRALEDAPYAFGSTLAREQAFSDEEWRRRMGTAAWWLARSGGRSVGLVAAIVDSDEPSYRQLVSMWVEEDARGGGAAAGLVAAVLDWAATSELVPAVVLWVAERNDRARRFYERMGFTPTGRTVALVSDPSVQTVEFIRAL